LADSLLLFTRRPKVSSRKRAARDRVRRRAALRARAFDPLAVESDTARSGASPVFQLRA
jgi:hypothetical protein